MTWFQTYINIHPSDWQQLLIKALDNNNIPTIQLLMSKYQAYTDKYCGGHPLYPCEKKTDILCSCLSHAKTPEALKLLLTHRVCEDHYTIDTVTITNALQWHPANPQLLDALIKNIEQKRTEVILVASTMEAIDPITQKALDSQKSYLEIIIKYGIAKFIENYLYTYINIFISGDQFITTIEQHKHLHLAPLLCAHMKQDEKNNKLRESTNTKTILILLKYGGNIFTLSNNVSTILHKIVQPTNITHHDIQSILIMPYFDMVAPRQEDRAFSRRRVLATILTLKQTILKDVIWHILAKNPEDIVSPTMLEKLAPYMNQDDINQTINRVPNAWFKGVYPSAQRTMIANALTAQRLAYAKKLCAIKNNNNKTAAEFTQDQTKLLILDPDNHAEYLTTPIRNQVITELEYK